MTVFNIFCLVLRGFKNHIDMLSEKEIEGLSKIQEERIGRETGFHEQVLFVSCTLLGILASLGIDGSRCRWSKVLETGLYIALPASILLESAALWWTKRSAVLLERLTKEALLSRERGVSCGMPFVRKPGIVRFSEAGGIFLFAVSVVLLSALKLMPLFF